MLLAIFPALRLLFTLYFSVNLKGFFFPPKITEFKLNTTWTYTFVRTQVKNECALESSDSHIITVQL